MILNYNIRGPNGYPSDPSPFTHPLWIRPHSAQLDLFLRLCFLLAHLHSRCLSHPQVSLSVLRIFPSVKFLPSSFLSFAIASHAFSVSVLLLVSSILTLRCVGKINGGKRRKGASCSENRRSQQGQRQRQEATHFSLISGRNPGFFFFFPFAFSPRYLMSFTFSIFNFETFVTVFLASLFTFVFVKEHRVGFIDMEFSGSPTCSLTIKYERAYGKGLRTVYLYTFKKYIFLFLSDHGFVDLVARYLSFVRVYMVLFLSE